MNNKDIDFILNSKDKEMLREQIALYKKTAELYKASLANIDAIIKEATSKYGTTLNITQLRKANKYESIKKQMEKEIARLNRLIRNEWNAQFKKTFMDSHIKTGFAVEVGSGLNFGFSLAPLESIQLEALDDLWLDALDNNNAKLLSDTKREFETWIRSNAREDVIGGLLEGAPYSVVQKRIKERFDVSQRRARMISFTEMHKAHNKGSVMAMDTAVDLAKDINIDARKVWKHNGVGDPRPDHKAAHNTQADEEGFFFVGGEKLKAPGLGTDARNNIYCHCSLGFIVPELEEVKTFEDIEDIAEDKGLETFGKETTVETYVATKKEKPKEVEKLITAKDYEKSTQKLMRGGKRYKVPKNTLRFIGNNPGDFYKVEKDFFKLEELKVLREFQIESNAVCDKLGIPRLRGFRRVEDAYTGRGTIQASMGDGLMNINRVIFQDYRKELKIRQEFREDSPQWKAVLDERAYRKTTAARKAGYFKKDFFQVGNVDEFLDDPLSKAKNTLWHEFGHHIHQQYKVRNKIQYLGREVKLVDKFTLDELKEMNMSLTPIESKLFVYKKSLIQKKRIALQKEWKRKTKNMTEKRLEDLGERPWIRRHMSYYRNYLSPSTYGDTNVKEWFAENFSLLQSGREDLVPTEFMDFLKKEKIIDAIK